MEAGNNGDIARSQYPRPGLRVLAKAPVPGTGRGLYRASNGDLYAVVADSVFYIDKNWAFNAVDR